MIGGMGLKAFADGPHILDWAHRVGYRSAGLRHTPWSCSYHFSSWRSSFYARNIGLCVSTLSSTAPCRYHPNRTSKGHLENLTHAKMAMGRWPRNSENHVNPVSSPPPPLTPLLTLSFCLSPPFAPFLASSLTVTPCTPLPSIDIGRPTAPCLQVIY